jgi:energy-coupling factor transporter ATP-binding protein EcfA2
LKRLHQLVLGPNGIGKGKLLTTQNGIHHYQRDAGRFCDGSGEERSGVVVVVGVEWILCTMMTKSVGAPQPGMCWGLSQKEGQRDLLDSKLLLSSTVYRVHKKG